MTAYHLAPRRHLTATAAVFVSAVVLAVPVAPAATLDPWAALSRLRAGLVGMGATTASFVQTYMPSGFDEGESEEGTLAIFLPRCMRWDYTGEFAKSFLLCDNTVHYWSPGDPLGEKYPLDDEESPGLDFFLLTPDELKERYEATAALSGENLQLSLLPRTGRKAHEHPGPAGISRVEATLSPAADRLLSLTYSDLDGNVTTFRILDYRPGAPSSLFVPPANLSWQEP